MKLWNELSMKEKHNIIRESVSKGIHSLDDIKAYYDNYYKDDIHLFLKGGERNYQTWKSLIAKYKGLDIDNDNTYDYEGYYNAYPNEAWDMLNDNPEVHFTDEFKTVYHPTFSNESSYNGKVNMLFNPYGKLGGTWTAGDVFIPAHNLPWPNKFAEGGDEDNLEAKAIKNFSKQNSEPFYSKFLANGYDENKAFQLAKRYYEEFKDSDKFLIDEGNLPEVIIKPSKNDRMSLTKLQRMIPDAASRQAMYDVLAPDVTDIPMISQNESIDRLYNVYASSKYPTVSSNRTLGNYLGALIRKENLNRPNYDIITNTISIPSEDTKYDATGFIPELAHAYQYYANDKRIKDNNLNSFLDLPGDIKINGKSGYERPGNREYSAHSIIEPAIWDYVEGKSNNIDFTPYLNPDAQRPYKTYHYHSQGGPLVLLANRYAEGGPKGKRFVDVLGNVVSAFGITPKYPDTMPTLWSEVLPEESYTELPTMTANQIEGRVAPLPNNNENFIPDFTNIKTKDNFGYNIDNLTTAYHYFKDNMKLNDYQIASLLANGIAESGFDPKAHNPKTSAKGLYQWLDGRYKYSSDKMSNTELLNELLQYINDTLNNTEDLMSWHHGGEGSGYNKAVEAHDRFYNAKNLYDAVHSFTYGYNRPDSVALRVKQRYDLAQKILERLLAKLQHKDGGKIYIKPENRGKFTALKKRTGHSASWFKAHGTPALKKMAIFALNSRKWHGLGGNIYDEESEYTDQMQVGRNYWQQQAQKSSWYDTIDPPINGGVLSEVIVTPTDDQNWLFSQGRYKHNSRKPLADASTRKMAANYLSQYENENAQSYNDRIKRLADIIYATNGVIFKANEVKKGKLKNRAHYNPREEIGYVTTMPDLLAELSHPYQEWFGNNKDQDEYNMGNYDSDSDPRGGTRYAYPDTYEGETHGFFEPALTEWVETGKISRSLPFLSKAKAKERITPKDWHEVVDSAKSWNQQAIDRRILSKPSQLDPWSRIKYSITNFPLLEKKKSLGGYLEGEVSVKRLLNIMRIRIKKLPHNSNQLNAKKWKHEDGGYIDVPNLLLPPTNENLIYSGHKSWYNR